MKLIDDFLNNITMYRLMLYYLLVILGVSFFLSFLGLLAFNPFALSLSFIVITLTCFIVNIIFARVFQVPANVESVYITAFILVLIITPTSNLAELPFLFWVGVLAMASKYIFAIHKKHLFNPVAIAVAIIAVTTNYSASWWVGTAYLMPVVVLGGFLIVRKIQRWDLVLSFLLVTCVAFLLTGFVILESPMFFLAFVMLTEPLTTPPKGIWRIFYGGLVGLGNFYATPEVALLVGNVFSYIVSPKQKLLLHLKEKTQLAPDIYDFTFTSPEKLSFSPGQYLEWTIHPYGSDSRGNRRYFTLASSPTEDNLRIGVKFSVDDGSSFKRSLFQMAPESSVLAGQLSGEFTLPQDPGQKMIFIAGGIGITPYRSMVKYLLDKGEKRDIVLFYSVNNSQEIIYRDIWEQASQIFGLRVFYHDTEKMGHLDEQKIMDEVPDYNERMFYLSGPHAMVKSFEDLLFKMGVKRSQIKTDYFPGFV